MGTPERTGTSVNPTRTADDAIHEGQAAGHDFDRHAVADIADYYTVTSEGVISGLNGPALVRGFLVVRGASPKLALYDNADGLGDPVYPQATTAHAIGDRIDLGAWVRFETAVYAKPSTTGSPLDCCFQVLAVPTTPA